MRFPLLSRSTPSTRQTPSILLRLAGVAVAVVAIVVMPQSARAQTLFTIGSGRQFGVLNVTTGAYTNLGTTTYNGTATSLFGLANAANGNLYALENVGTSTPRLFQVNRTNGTLSLVAAVSGFGPAGSGLNGLGNTSDGTLYAYHRPTGANNTVYTINASSAMATPVGGGTGGTENTGTSFAGAINGDGNGGLFATGGFYSINRTTGAATLLQSSTGAGNVQALGFTNNNLYALNTTGGIFTINTANGVATNTNVTYDTNLAGFLVGAASVTPFATPEPATLPLIGMGLATGAGMAGTLSRKRETVKRRKQGKAKPQPV